VVSIAFIEPSCPLRGDTDHSVMWEGETCPTSTVLRGFLRRSFGRAIIDDPTVCKYD